MNLKSISIGVLVLAVLAAAGWWFFRKPEPAADAGNLQGEKLLAPEILAKATRIVLNDPEGDETVTLVKEQSGDWVLPDFHGFAIDFSKLKTLSENLVDAGILRFATRNPERLKNLELGEKRVTLIDEQGGTLWEIETGKRGPSGGAFVRIGNAEEAWLSDLSAYLDTSEKNWPNKKMLTFQSAEVASMTVTFSGGEPEMRLSRESADAEFDSESLADGEQLVAGEVTGLLSSLLNARYSEVREKTDPDAMAAREHSRSISLKLFNGDGYTVTFGRKPAEPVLEDTDAESVVEEDEAVQTSESGEPPALDADDILSSINDRISEEPDEPEMTDPGPAFFFYSSINPNDRLNQIMEKVALEYSSYVFEQLPESRDKLVETVATENPDAADISDLE